MLGEGENLKRAKFYQMRIRKEKYMDKNQKNKLYNKDEKVNREDFQCRDYRNLREHRARMRGISYGGKTQMPFQATPARIHNHRRRLHHSRNAYELQHRQGRSFRGQKHHFEKQRELHRGYQTNRRHANMLLFQEQEYLRNLIHLLRKRLDRVSFQLHQRRREWRLHRFEGQIS